MITRLAGNNNEKFLEMFIKLYLSINNEISNIINVFLLFSDGWKL